MKTHPMTKIQKKTAAGRITGMLPSGQADPKMRFCPGCKAGRLIEAELRQVKHHFNALRQKQLSASARIQTARSVDIQAATASDFVI